MERKKPVRDPKLANVFKKPAINYLPKERKRTKNGKIMFRTPALRGKFFEECFIPTALKGIMGFLDPNSLLNFILAQKKFYKTYLRNDKLFYFYYTKRFNSKVNFSKFTGKWRETFFSQVEKTQTVNKKSINAFFKNKQRIHSVENKKNPYFLTHFVFSKLKPEFWVQIDGAKIKAKTVFTERIMSHVNIHLNIDTDYYKLSKIKEIKLLVSERNVGLRLVEVESVKPNQLSDSVKTKCFDVKQSNSCAVALFEGDYLFFVNFSVPICKFCDRVLPFLGKVHDTDTVFFDDISSKHGLIDYVLLINLKSQNRLFFNLFERTVDFTDEGDFIVFESKSQS